MTLTHSPSTTARPRSSARGQRTASRVLHLVAGVALAVFVDGPPQLTGAMQPWMQLVAVPALSATGLFLWKQAQLRRLVASIT